MIDRRPEYYDRAAASIAADALGFYVRAERGRRLLLGGFPWPVKVALVVPNVVVLAMRKAAR